MKKRVVLLLTGMLVFALAGCGKATAPAESSTAPIATQTIESENQAEPSQEQTTESTSEEDPITEYSLRELFAQHNMKVGTCLTPQMTSNVNSSKIILSQFNSITMENAMKPDAILNKSQSVKDGELVVDITKDMIKMLDWAKNNNMAVRGHTLVWYSQTPEWIFHENFNLKEPLVDRETMLGRMESMIKQIFEKLDEKGYLELFYAYDIVNEAWMENGTMRDNKWKTIIGDDYLWYAFYYANMYAPDYIDLYYNDYNEQYKTEALYKFVNTLVDEDGNYLIDGVGFQAHLYTNDDLNTYFRTMDRIAETGLKIQLTELDVCLGAWQNIKEPTEENLKAQGRYYYNLINGIFERVDAGTVNMDALTFWGFSDALSWRKEYNPLLYNTLYAPKYAYYGAMQIKELAGFNN